jgi:exopolysaccharide biosynthesis protein
MKKIVLAIFLTLFCAGCGGIIPTANYPYGDGWHVIDDSISFIDWEYGEADETQIIKIFRLRPADFNISLEYSSEEPKYVSEWIGSLEDAEIVINGAYFHEDYSPSGYLKIDYSRIGERIFDQNLSGLLVIENNELSIRNLGKDPLSSGEKVENGLQSYPFLIKDLIRGFKEDSGKKAHRTAIGLDNNDYIYIILVDDHRITLYDLMVELIKTNIEFTQVLNLDGGTSTGMIIKRGNYEEIHDSMVKVPSVIVFSKR